MIQYIYIALIQATQLFRPPLIRGIILICLSMAHYIGMEATKLLNAKHT